MCDNIRKPLKYRCPYKIQSFTFSLMYVLIIVVFGYRTFTLPCTCTTAVVKKLNSPLHGTTDRLSYFKVASHGRRLFSHCFPVVVKVVTPSICRGALWRPIHFWTDSEQKRLWLPSSLYKVCDLNCILYNM